MLKEVDWSPDRSFRTGSENEPIQFYMDGLCHSQKLDLLLGYFSSAAINLLSLGFATFLYKGGTMRMAVNNILSQEDKDAIKAGKSGEMHDSLIDLSDIKKLSITLNEYGKHFFNCLAWLISNDRIQIKIIRPKDGRGISHYKSGAFYDGVDTVGFKASCNFTVFGLSENLEELDAFLSWENSRSSKMINRQNKDFEDIFSGNSEVVEYLNIEDIQIAIKNEFGNCSINELLIKEQDLIDKKKSLFENKRLNKSFEDAYNKIEEINNEPRFPFPEGPRQYQLKAYQNWVENNCKGLFAMATGTGKTITALNCVVEQFKKDGYYRFIVLVPTISLATQWEKEVIKKFNFQEVVVCSSLNNEWEDSVRSYGSSLKFGGNPNFCIIITYASFRMKRFQYLLNDIFKNDLKSFILIADEAHTLGSKNLLKVLPFGIEKRIGLSATPERQYDNEGDKELSNYFDSVPPNYTFKYDMKQAIDAGVLCRYYYYPKIVELEQEELNAYRVITNKLMKYLDPNTGKYKDDPYVNNLLIQRKNIIHKAKNKSDCLIHIIDEIGQNNFEFAFIYVPEGFETNYEEVDIDINSEVEDANIINEYTNLLYNKYKFKLRKFTGSTNDRDEVLKQFSSGQLDALLAMKCLDEGVDIPQTKYAIFCSSTGNPRQYIQRRGRVLRYHDKKDFAYIYDMIVKPTVEETSTDQGKTNIEKNILLNELKRLVNFAVLSENKVECLSSLEDLCHNLGIDIYDLANKEEEKYLN